MKKSTTTTILWAVYICLLVVLLPHTAWAFRQFEPIESLAIYGDFTVADLLSYVIAFAFEAAIAVLTHKLAKHIELVKRIYVQRKNPDGTYTRMPDDWATLKARYIHPISFGLLISTLLSGMANLAHAVQFGQTMTIFTQWHIPQGVYSVAFGGILPLVSLTFARVLSDVTDTEDAPNPELDEAKKSFGEAKMKLRETEGRLKASEERAKLAEDKFSETEVRLKVAEEQTKTTEAKLNETEQKLRDTEAKLLEALGQKRLAEERFGAMGDLVKYLFGENKKQRILAARQEWPELPNASIAIITKAKPSYVSEVLSGVETVEVGQGS